MAVIKGDARNFSFVARKEDEGKPAQLSLPVGSRVMFLYRNDKFVLPDGDTTLQKGDEVVLVFRSKVLPALEARWNPAVRETR